MVGLHCQIPVYWTLACGFDLLVPVYFLAIVARFDRPTYIFTDNVTQGTVTVELTGRSEVDIILQYSIRDNRGRGLYDSTY